MTTGFSYSAGEALILTTVRTTSAYSSTNSAIFSWRLLNQGKSATYALLRWGGTDNRQLTFTRQMATHLTLIEVWQRWKTDTAALTDLAANVAQVVDKLDAARKLGDTTGKIVDSAMINVSEPEEMWRNQGDGPSWLRATLTVRWLSEVDVSYAA